jgi:hypothetical protein
MLSKNPKWCGIDMRARWRRRVAAGLTYAAFLLVVWVHPWRTDELLLLMYFGGAYLWNVNFLMKDSIAVEARRIVLGAVFLGVAWFLWRHPAPPKHMTADMWAFFWVAGWSALSYAKLVAPVWLRSSVRRWLGKRRCLKSFDEFAEHYYGESFAELTEAQQMEVRQMERANPEGEWVVRGSARFPTVEDERLRHEDDRVRAQVQRVMTWILIGSALGWRFMNISCLRSVSGDAFAAWAWTMAALGNAASGYCVVARA